MKDRLLEVLNDALNTRRQTATQKYKELKYGNHSIMCAIRLMTIIGVSDFDETIELSIFIKNSWTDLEPTDEQMEKIVTYMLVEMREKRLKKLLEKDYGHE